MSIIMFKLSCNGLKANTSPPPTALVKITKVEIIKSIPPDTEKQKKREP
jgi:hypothetical protein